jgi:hypothetical protein
MRVLRVFILLIVGLMWTCSPHDELEIPSNPLDPDNPVYVSPQAEITSGPSEGEVVNATMVTFEWQGNETASEYSYSFDGSDWSDWSQIYSMSMEYLDEGDHSFQVKARSINADVQLIPTAIDFVVDAVSGPSAIVYPYLQHASPGDTLEFEIRAEEVTNLFALEVEVFIDTQYLELIEVLDGDIVDEWGGDLLQFQDQTDSTTSLSMVAVEGESISFTGTTSLLYLKAKIAPSIPYNSIIHAIRILNTTYLNQSLDVVEISGTRVGTIIDSE